jgi:glutamine synthetase
MAHPTVTIPKAQLDELTLELRDDNRVKVAGVDLDGILRGKIMAKSKFLSVLESGFGFCSVVFGWDMHDKTYEEELSVSNAANGSYTLWKRAGLHDIE